MKKQSAHAKKGILRDEFNSSDSGSDEWPIMNYYINNIE